MDMKRSEKGWLRDSQTGSVVEGGLGSDRRHRICQHWKGCHMAEEVALPSASGVDLHSPKQRELGAMQLRQSGSRWLGRGRQ